MRGIHERIVVLWPFARHHLLGFIGDAVHREDEAFDLPQILRFGRLNHEGARNGEAHGRRVETVVDETLGDIVDGDPRAVREGAQVHDALVCHEPVLTTVENLKFFAEPLRHVVRGEHRRSGRMAQTLRTHEANVGPRDREDRRRTVRRLRHGRTTVGAVCAADHRVFGVLHVRVAR